MGLIQLPIMRYRLRAADWALLISRKIAEIGAALLGD
jgi:hypothetical protein